MVPVAIGLTVGPTPSAKPHTSRSLALTRDGERLLARSIRIRQERDRVIVTAVYGREAPAVVPWHPLEVLQPVIERPVMRPSG